MANKADETFFQRADAHIKLSNEQISKDVSHGKVSASMLYAAARFNAWVSATGFVSRTEMAKSREETLDYFCKEYRKMLEENLDDYIQNYEKYMGRIQ
jgi:predicted metal-dependent hydrolase